MTGQQRVLSDARRRPRLFVWAGSPERHALHAWLARTGWRVPEDLLQLWRVTGGGEILESETILLPVSDSDTEGAEGFNAKQYLAGMPRDYVVFHTGLGGMSAVKLSDHCYVQLSPEDFQETARFDSLGDWYSRLLLAEYGERYGL